MKKLDVVVLTDSRYVNPPTKNDYINNVLKEDELVMNALKKFNLKVDKKDWNDAVFDWSTTRSVIFRSTWDYFDKFDEFKIWLNKIKNQCFLINSHEIISWNVDKHYLLDLQNKGIPIPESIFIPKNKSIDLSSLMNKNQWDEIVVKPTISGAAKNTYRLKEEDLSSFQNKWENLISQEDFIIQEFQKQVISKGEVALMVFGGKYTHAVLKQAKKGDFRVQDDFGGSIATYNPDKEMIKLAEKSVQTMSPVPAYARVDVIWNNKSELVVSELELIEPELWFRLNPHAADVLAKYINGLLAKKI